MERIGVPLSRCDAIGWHETAILARHIVQDAGSHTFRALHPEDAAYQSPLHIAAMLADLYDLTASFAVMFARAHSGGRTVRNVPKYPRPWAEDGDVKKIGAGPIPVAEFDTWYYGGG